jgi:hypothetical protein
MSANTSLIVPPFDAQVKGKQVAMQFPTYAPMAKPQSITGFGDAKQLSSSFTNPAKQPTGHYSSMEGSALQPGQKSLASSVLMKKLTASQAAKAPAAKTPAGTGTQSIYDLSTDPIVQKIRSLNTSNYGQSVADADAARKQALIDAGFGDLARATKFGSLENPTTGDQATVLAAQANPFSLAAQLARAHAQALQGIDQGAAQNNTYFSSARGNQIGDEGRQYLGNVSSVEGQLRQQLANILSGLVGTRAQEQQSEADALSQARQNAIQTALASGATFTGYDANGNPTFATPGATAPGAPDTSGGAAAAVPGNPGPPDSASRGGSAASPVAQTAIANALAARAPS